MNLLFYVVLAITVGNICNCWESKMMGFAFMNKTLCKYFSGEFEIKTIFLSMDRYSAVTD